MVDVAFHAGCRRSCTVALSQRKAGHGYGSYGFEAPTAQTSGRRASGAASRHITRRGGQPPGAVASARSLRRCRSRGRRRKAKYVGDDGVGGAQYRGEQDGQVEVALASLVVESGHKVAKKSLASHCAGGVIRSWSRRTCIIRRTSACCGTRCVACCGRRGGRLSNREREDAESFVAARRAHPAIESAINGLEHRGLDRVRSHGADGFARTVALSVLAANLHRGWAETPGCIRRARRPGW